MKKKIFFSCLVSVALLWFALRGTDWHEIHQSLKDISYLSLVPVVLAFAITHLFRVWRYQILLNPIKKISFKEMFAINSVGFLFIHILPIRLGEFVRPMLFKKRHGIPMSTGLATVGVERVFDGIVASSVLLVGIFFAPDDFGKTDFLPFGVKPVARAAVAMYAFVLGFLVLAVFQKDRALWLASHFVRWAPRRFQEKLSEFFKHMFEGLRALKDTRSVLLIFSYSVGVWGIVVFGYWLGLEAMGIDVPWSAPFTTLGFAVIGISVPAGPGFVGNFQVAIQWALYFYGISKSVGLAYSLVIHIINLGWNILAGLAFLPMMSTKMRGLVRESTHQQELLAK